MPEAWLAHTFVWLQKRKGKGVAVDAPDSVLIKAKVGAYMPIHPGPGNQRYDFCMSIQGK